MPLHDDYARITPFELAFPDPEEGEERLRRITTEAEEQGGVDDLQAFMLLGSVTGWLQKLRPAEEEGQGMHQYASLAFHTWRFHRAGRPFWLLETATARYLVDGAPGGAPELPAESGYLQLPQHLFWVEPGPGETPESVDGLFWYRSEGGILHVLLAMGIRPDRAGLGVVPVADAPWTDAPRWLEADIRPDGDDFETTLPGGDLEGLYSFEAAGEVLKLLARALAYRTTHPGAESAWDPHPAEETADGAPRPSRFPYRRLTLSDASP